MSDDVYTYLLGEGGWATLVAYTIKDSDTGRSNKSDDYIVPYISASVERNMNIPKVECSNIPWSDEPRSSIRLGKGTYTFSGNINFELTKELKKFLFGEHSSSGIGGMFFYRNCMFDISIADTSKIILNGCSWNNFSMNCSANSLINCSFGFSSLNLRDTIDSREDFVVEDWSPSPPIVQEDSHILEPYWQYGVDDISLTNFSINISRNVEPIFLNNQLTTPTYLRIGALDVDISFSCVSDWIGDSEIPASFSLGDGYFFQLLNDYQSQKSYEFHGFNDVGNKTYSIKGSNNSIKEVFQIIKQQEVGDEY